MPAAQLSGFNGVAPALQRTRPAPSAKHPDTPHATSFRSRPAYPQRSKASIRLTSARPQQAPAHLTDPRQPPPASQQR